MSTQLAISAGGAAVGYLGGSFFGQGALGAQLGWTLASYLSADENKDASQKTIADVRLQTAQYGINIPLLSGAERVTGNIIWASDKKPYETKSVMGGGKGGDSSTTTSTTTTGYKASFAIAICKGPILGISKVWQDGKLIIDSSTSVKKLIGTLYTGTNVQLADATMQSYLGAANVPAYRGMAYIVCHDFDLGMAGRIPTFSFEVLKTGGI